MSDKKKNMQLSEGFEVNLSDLTPEELEIFLAGVEACGANIIVKARPSAEWSKWRGYVGREAK